MWKCRVHVRELDRVLSQGPKLLNAHIARMVVLYHDLQLELFATAADRVKELELLTKEHRQMYFIRRSIGTIAEFAEEVRLLDQLPEFTEIKRGFDGVTIKRWDKSVRFFNRREPYIEKIRNDFGGHFGLKAAIHAIENLTPYAALLEFNVDSVRRRAGVKMEFAGELVALAMGRHRLAKDSNDHYRLMFRLTLAAGGHSARLVHMLALLYLEQRFTG
jgi:hypothetical protein